jgi:hypothetical protein
MKTPREILLKRHAPANEKLDAIRQKAIRVAAEANRQGAPDREFTFAATIFHALTIPFRELIWRAWRIWAGFVLVWLAIVAVNLADSDRGEIAESKSRSVQSGTLMAWGQEQKLFTDLLGPADAYEADKPKSVSPKPRSERPLSQAMG